MKKTIKLLTKLLVVLLLVYPVMTAAAEGEKKKNCRKPRIRSIKPPEKSEVAPESEFSFTLPVWSDPKKVEVTVKKIKAEAVVENRNSFFLVKVTIPPELTGTYARVSVKATAELGCVERDGWLYKISE